MNKCKVGMNCKVEFNGVDKENLTVPIIISDETVVQRYSWDEGEYYLTLDHNENSILMDRAEILNLFVNHNTSDLPIAVFQEIKVEDKKLKGVARFDKDDESSLKLFKKIEKGFLKTFSVGADIVEKSLEKEVDGVKYYRVTKWMPTEVSIAPIPAIPNAKVGMKKESVAIPTATSDKIAKFTKGETQMEFNKENFEALRTEKETLAAELAKAKADVEAKQEELSQIDAEKENLSKKIAENKEIIGLAYEFDMSKDDAMSLLDSESLSQANGKVLELFKSNGITLKGDDTDEKFEHQNESNNSKELWSKIRNKG